MASKVTKISKLGAAVITMDIILTIPETSAIFREPGSAASQNVIMAAYSLDCSQTALLYPRVGN